MNDDLPYSGVMIKTVWEMMNMKSVKATYRMVEQTVLNNITPKERKKVFGMFVAKSLVVSYQVAHGVSVYSSQIMCPKLVIGCTKDVIAPPSMQKGIADFLRADFIIYEQFAHLPMLEKGWEKSTKDIRDWLKIQVPEKELSKKEKM